MGENFLPKTFTVLVLLCTAITQHTLGQVTDDFNDGNFSDNLAWSGSASNYIVNVSFQLRLNALVAGTSYLTTPFTAPANHNVTWEFFLRQNFAPSGSNVSRVYLMSSQNDLTAQLNGYFLQFGEDGANDAIKLFRQTGATNTQVCAGPAATISANPVIIRVRVTRSVAGEWVITADYTGGSTFVAVAAGNDNTHTSSAYFGFRSTYSVSNVQNFFYDDVSITTQEAPDETAPTLTDVDIVSATAIELVFSEDLNAETVSLGNIQVNGSGPASAILQGNQNVISIALNAPLQNGHEFVLQVSGVEDLADNVIEPLEQSILYFQPVASQKHDLTITEFYPDPNPSIGLPLAEFVEILNRSNHPFDLAGWKITDQSSIGTLTTRILLPGEYLILCHSSDVASFNAYGAVMGLTTFPGLNNSGDTIKIVNPLGEAIDSLVYNMSWYDGLEDKQSGGWTLEKINPHDFCKENDNWTPGVNPMGGTPGQLNSVLQISQDVDGPKVIGAIQKDDVTITLAFNEKLDVVVPTADQFMISPSMAIDTISFINGFTAIDIGFVTSLDSSALYSFTVQNVFDCPGNLIQAGFDSIAFKLDSIPPSLQSIHVVSDTTIEISFSERLTEDVFEVGRFSLLNGHQPNEIIKLSSKSIRLIFETAFENGVVQTLVLKNISDNAGNEIDSLGINFLFFEPVEPSFKDIIFSELFPDPAPTVGLPEAEFIEILNRSNHPFNLQGWQVTDGSSVGVFPDKILLSGQYVIVCASAYKNSFLPFGETIGLSVFPSLNNSEDRLKLIAPSSQVIDSVSYELKWYHDVDKDDGGHSLEIINPDDFCKDVNNWTASSDVVGGTPGEQNSVYSDAVDLTGPRLISLEGKDAQSLLFTFNEKMNVVLPVAADIHISPAIEIASIAYEDTELTKLSVDFIQPLDSAVRYNITLSGLKDCAGNQIQGQFSTASIKLDTLLPQIVSWTIVSHSTIELTFSKKLNSTSAAHLINYDLAHDQHPEQASFQESKVLHLTFDPPFKNGVDQVLSVMNLEDVFGNRMEADEISFRYFEPVPTLPKDVVITELFPDPSPVVRLPETEFIEVFNRSTNAIDLGGWTISDGGTSSTLQSKILLPGNFLILCPSNRIQLFSTYGQTMGLSAFPSLNNTADTLTLKNMDGITIDSVNYSDEYYRDDQKQEGGWTLELIDPENICAEETNWIASEDAIGGTPGRVNSVYEEKPDLSPPILLSVFPENQNTMKLTLNEKLEKDLPQFESIQITPALSVSEIHFYDKSLRSLIVRFSEPITEGIAYSVAVSNIFDCAGNVLNPVTAAFALPQQADSSTILVNEVLFNPRSTGVDFVECYNNSDKFVNLKNWTIANVISDTIQNKKKISETDLLFYPHTYLVFTHDGPILKGEYLSGIEDTFVQVSLPSMPDDEGSVVLIDANENVIDLLQYSAEYHSVFLKDDEGVSLERIHFDQPTNIVQNWKSASANVGFATPGYMNSNSVTTAIEEENVNVQPEVFSPTGQQGFAEIHYQFDKGNLVANVKVVDAQGREVKVLADNELLGANGFLRWDGDKTDGSKARIGTYMIWFEVFDETGRVETIKKPVVLAERF
jgi:hypothetical protein